MSQIIRSQYDSSERADIYQRLLQDTDWRKEASGVFPWLCDRLSSNLQPDTLVGDFGCGTGRLLPLLCADRRQVLGVDFSREMLRRVVVPAESLPSEFFLDVVTAQAVTQALALRRHVFAAAALEEFLPELGKAGVLVDAAINSFNSVCFPHPAIPIGSIARCLKPGGVLYFASNVFHPRELVTPATEPFYFDLFADLSTPNSLNLTELMFRHLVNTPAGPVPFQDYVHTLEMVRCAFSAEEWQVREAILFPGYEADITTDPATEHLFPSSSDVELLERDNEFAFCKIGILAVRRDEIV